MGLFDFALPTAYLWFLLFQICKQSVPHFEQTACTLYVYEIAKFQICKQTQGLFYDVYLDPAECDCDVSSLQADARAFRC